ncbi:hypothetical protein CBR_g50842 [Chara braunii]|uniref:ATP synthase subunit f, mitochondrial n=1 Tax=Chara braunii TaxID=69332 RepID=A0A388M7K9_CHABU|nr:hypothetical protein CBR_g50842 [Chara braunii]|eukprot:GBG90495.1 hypothetical protein CBR_g50842 [Chara braunii]
MMMQVAKEIAKMKVKEVPEYVKSVATKENITNKTLTFLQRYQEKYIKTGSIRPLNDVLISVGILGYAVSWPKEYRHMQHEKEKAAAKAAGKGHH